MLYVLLILTHTCTNGTLAGILYQWTKCIDNTKDFFSIWLNCVVAWSLSHVQLFVTPWTAAHQASLSFTISQSLLKFKSIELVMLSNHLILCSPLLLLSSILPFTPRVLIERPTLVTLLGAETRNVLPLWSFQCGVKEKQTNT